MIVVTDKRQEFWQIGNALDVPLSRVVEIEADGEELRWIHDFLPHLHTDKESQVFRGVTAVCIVAVIQDMYGVTLRSFDAPRVVRVG